MRMAASGASAGMKLDAEVISASAEVMKGEMDEAEVHFRRLVNGADEAGVKAIAEGQIDLIERLLAAKRYDLAARVAEGFLAGRTDFAAGPRIRAGLLSGAADEKRGRPAEAQMKYWRLLRTHRKDPKHGAAIAARFVDLTMRPGSGLSFGSEQEKVLRDFPQPAIRIGRRFLADGRAEEADGWFASAESAAAGAGGARGAGAALGALAKVMRLRVKAASGKAAEAEAALRGIAAKYPAAGLARAEAKLALGRVRLAGGYTSAARKLFAELEKSAAAAEETGHVAAMAAVGFADALRLGGDRDRSAEEYSRAMSVYSDDEEAVVEAMLGLGELRHVTKARAEARKMWKQALDGYEKVASSRAVAIARIMNGKVPATQVPRLVEGRAPVYAADLYYFGALRLEQENSVIDAMEYYRRAAETGGKSYWRSALARKRQKDLEK